MRPSVFTIIVNYNSDTLLRRAVESVCAARDVEGKIVVVDNASDDDSVSVCYKKFPRVHYIKNTTNSGFAAGANQGIRYALEYGTDFIFVLNPDAYIAPHTLSQLIAPLAKNQKYVTAPLIKKTSTEEIWFFGGIVSWLTFRAKHTLSPQRHSDAQTLFFSRYLTGCAVLFPRAFFHDVGFFDERYFLYYEDADLSMRATKAGYHLMVVPCAQAWHDERSEALGSIKIYYLVLSGLHFFSRNTPPMLLPWFYLHFFLRRVKNYLRIRFFPSSHDAIITRAYDDFTKKRTKN